MHSWLSSLAPAARKGVIGTQLCDRIAVLAHSSATADAFCQALRARIVRRVAASQSHLDLMHGGRVGRAPSMAILAMSASLPPSAAGVAPPRSLPCPPEHTGEKDPPPGVHVSSCSGGDGVEPSCRHGKSWFLGQGGWVVRAL